MRNSNWEINYNCLLSLEMFILFSIGNKSFYIPDTTNDVLHIVTQIFIKPYVSFLYVKCFVGKKKGDNMSVWYQMSK